MTMEPDRPDGEALETRHTYALYGEIARGGMATIRLGRQNGPHGLCRIVAVKELHAQYAHDEGFVEMFRDEVQVASRVSHPNVVPILDIVSERGQSILVMEYVHGASIAELGKLVRRPFPVDIAATIIVGVLHGLHAAHETRSENGRALRIIHRDVTPQNVVVGVDGSPRILDFGIARANGRRQTTRFGQIKGKLAYVSPEQLQGQDFDRRVDIYSSSVMLWEMLTGRSLFRSKNRQLLTEMILRKAVENPSVYNPAVPAALDEIVMRGLNRQPSLRFPTAREMALSIETRVGTVSASYVGEWVMQAWGEASEARTRELRAIEDDVSPPSSTWSQPTSPAPSESPETTEATTQASAPGAPSSGSAEGRRRHRGHSLRPLPLVVVGLLGMSAAAGLLATAFRRAPLPSTHTLSTLAGRHQSETLPRIRPLLTMLTSAEKDGPSATLKAPGGQASSPPVHAARRGPAVRRPVEQAASSPPPLVPPTECLPPYFYDAAGIKHFKLDCL